MSFSHTLEAGLAYSAAAGFRALPWRASLKAGAAVGDLARGIGLRARVARSNLAIAFPEKSESEREAILREHYRELGRVLSEYPRLDEWSREDSPAFAEIHGLEHLDRAHAAGRGAILMSGHFSNFELMAARVGRFHPMDVLTRRLSNAGVDRWLTARRHESGLGTIASETGVREVYGALRANRFIAMLADQDARSHGVFVPFFGRPTSTALGPARIALATGAPIITGFTTRGSDGRLTVHLEAPLELPDPKAEDAALALTALHAARLEHWVRQRPELWFWLHRRWKTAAPAGAGVPAATH